MENMENDEYQNLLDTAMNDVCFQKEITGTPENFNYFIKELINSNGGQVPGSDVLTLSEKLGEQFIYSAEATKQFTDKEMLILYQSMFNPWKLEDITNYMYNPTFTGIQSAFMATVKNDHQESFEYLIKNFPMEEFDIDGLGLYIALEKGAINILWFISSELDKEKYGFEGSLAGMIHPKIRDMFNSVKYLLPPELSTELSKFKVLGVN